MINKYLLYLLPVLALLSGCAMDKATEARLEHAIEEAAKKPSTTSTSGPRIYYDTKTAQWRSSDGMVCATCTSQQGFAKPVVQGDDMYYDPEIKKWRQSSMRGEVCHTCTPQNGFPIPPTGKSQSDDVTLPQERGGWCKNEVVGRYNTYMADVSIVDEQGNKIFWKVDSTGKAGHCLFNDQNKFVKIIEQSQSSQFKKTGQIYWSVSGNQWVAPDGQPCATCTPNNGFPTPPKMNDGFFYLPADRKWYDWDGKVCATCTPDNGFPIPAN